MQICTYMERLSYNQPIDDGRVKSEWIELNGEKFVGSKNKGKDYSIWVILTKTSVKYGKKEYRFPMPVSMMYNIKKTMHNGVPHIIYTMAKGFHNNIQFGKKVNGQRVFKPKKSCHNCEGYRPNQTMRDWQPISKRDGSSGSHSGGSDTFVRESRNF